MLKMSITIERCKNCGGPLQSLAIPCEYCDMLPGPLPRWRIPRQLPVDRVSHLGRLMVGNTPYLVHGRLAQGTGCEVFLARRDTPMTEMVLLKVGQVEREWDVLAQLRRRAQGTYLASLLPSPVHCVARTSVWRWRSDFMHTLEDVRRAYPQGIPCEAAAWLGNRLLEQLTQLEELGYCHGNLSAPHMLVHPRAHGLILCGWSHCQRGTGLDASKGLAVIASLLGRSPLKAFLSKASGRAAVLKEELKRVSLAALGPSKFCPLSQIERRFGDLRSP